MNPGSIALRHEAITLPEANAKISQGSHSRQDRHQLDRCTVRIVLDIGDPMAIRVLVVDDSAFMRKMLSAMIGSDAGLELVGTARDGADAVVKTLKLQPDVVTLDIQMPVMNGIEALRKILNTSEIVEKPSILMCSCLTDGGSPEMLQAMRLGASDFIAKNSDLIGQGDDLFCSELIGKIKAIRHASPQQGHSSSAADGSGIPSDSPCIPIQKFDLNDLLSIRPECVVIGSSTGGPPVIETLILALQENFPVPVLVAQHMPALFSRSLAARLDAMAPAQVRIANHGEPLEPGMVYIGEGGSHVRVRRLGTGLYTEVSPNPAETHFKPSINELFTSAAKYCGSHVLGIILTGMGDDGLIGARAIHSAGGRVITQQADSCVVYGMPRTVYEAGLSSGSGTPGEMASVLTAIGDIGSGYHRRSA